MGLRCWFGPSKEDIWRQLSTEIGGRLVKGGFAKGDKVQVSHGEWTLTLDTYVVMVGKTPIQFTRMRAPYVNPEGFRFEIYRRGVFSDIGKFFGMQDIEINDAAFDEAFIIKGTDERRVRELLANPRIRQLIAAQDRIGLSVRDDEGWFGPSFPEGVDELQFNAMGVIKDIERLKLLFELFSETLEQLCRIGTAYEDRPGVVI
jgi:hypothetical protein